LSLTGTMTRSYWQNPVEVSPEYMRSVREVSRGGSSFKQDQPPTWCWWLIEISLSLLQNFFAVAAAVAGSDDAVEIAIADTAGSQIDRFFAFHSLFGFLRHASY
jgi:hypothetical protein